MMIRVCLPFYISISLILISDSFISALVRPVREDDNTTDRCNDLLNEFAAQSSKFSLCSVIHARPIRVCQRCVNQFENVSNIYKMIHKSNNSHGQKCKEILLNADRLGILQQVNLSIQDLWNRGHCQSCYNINTTTGEHQLASNTVKFIELHSGVLACINNHTQQDEEKNSTVCKDCEKEYCDLNAFYNKLKETMDDAVCMDIVDSMNQTRILWSDNLKCVKRESTLDVPLLATTVSVSLLPFIFYLGAKLFSSQIRNQLQAQKRLAEHINPSTSQEAH